MTISILICVHSNDLIHDSMLLVALESLQKQVYKDFDLFIVFDECWYNTNNIIKEEKYDFKITKLIHTKKEGLAFAKNYGLKYIKSEWVCFLDADDLYLPNKLEKQVEYVKNNQVDFLSTLAWNKYNNSDIIFESCFKSGIYETHDQLVNVLKEKENVLTHGSMMIRKSCLDELNGYNNVKGMEDWDLWKRAIEKGYKFHQLQERLYIYTIGSSVER